MSDEVSLTSGTSPTSGSVFHSVPYIVLFDVMCTYAAAGVNTISSARGMRVNCSAFVVAATSNFIWNRVWTFKIEHGEPHVQYARFLAVSLLALAIDLAALAFLVEVVGLHKPVAAAIAIVVATPISFLGNKLWSFAA